MILTKNGETATLQGKFSSELHLQLGQLEGRRKWSNGGLTILATKYNLSLVEPYALRIIDQTPVAVKVVEAKPYTPRTKPYPHQERALKAWEGQLHFALFMEQGTGKTKVILDRAGQLFMNGQITGLMVVTKKRVHVQWAEDEAPKHMNVAYHATWFGQKAKSIKKPPAHPHLSIFTINYDALKFAKGMAAAEEFCKAHGGQLMIAADESQEIKDASTSRHKALSRLIPYSAYRVIATGTPLAKNLLDEWSQLKWLDEAVLGIKYKTTFMREFCVMGGFEGRVVVGHKNIARFKGMTAPYVFRATKEEIGLLPKAYERWRFDLSSEQVRVIRELKNQLGTLLENGVAINITTGPHILAKIQQAASGFLYDEEGKAHPLVDPSANPRLEAAFDWFEANEGKAIIWARFREDLNLISAEAKRRNIAYARFGGEDNDSDRAKAVAGFSKGDTQLLIASQAAAGTGLNLQISGCRRALYYSNSFKAIDRWQSEDRIHRIGIGQDVCTFTDLIAKGGCDTYILNNIRRKKSLSNLVLDDIRELIGALEDDEYDAQVDAPADQSDNDVMRDLFAEE